MPFLTTSNYYRLISNPRLFNQLAFSGLSNHYHDLTVKTLIVYNFSKTMIDEVVNHTSMTTDDWASICNNETQMQKVQVFNKCYLFLCETTMIDRHCIFLFVDALFGLLGRNRLIKSGEKIRVYGSTIHSCFRYWIILQVPYKFF